MSVASTLLGFDYGSKSIGIAVGNSVTGTAQPLEAVRVLPRGPDWRRIDTLVKEWRPDAMVLGLPLNMDGTETHTTPQARAFGDALHHRYNRPVHLVDERLTTHAALHALDELGISGRRRSKADVDSMAAQTILQAYLNENNKQNTA